VLRKGGAVLYKVFSRAPSVIVRSRFIKNELC